MTIIMVLASYWDDATRKKRWAKQLSEVRNAIKSFPSLEKEFNNFDEYSDKSYDAFVNAVLSLLLNGNKDTLTKLEEILSTSPNSFLDSKARMRVVKRLKKTSDPNESLSVVNELDIVSQIVKKIGSANVKYEPALPNKKRSDIYAKVNGKEIFLEIFNLVKGETARKIEDIMRNSAEYLVKIVKNPSRLCLDIDTAALPTERINTQKGECMERIDEESSKKKLKSEIDALKFDMLPAQVHRFSTQDIVGYLEKVEYLETHPLNSKEVGLFDVESEQTELWQSSLNVDSVRKIELIKSFLSFPASEGKYVQVGEVGDLPSRVFKLELESLLERFIKKLEQKISARQFHPDSPNIIVGLWSHWGMYTGFYQSVLSNLISRIKSEVLTISGSECISGAAILTTIFPPIVLAKATFIPNTNAKTSSKLSQKELVDLGLDDIRWDS